MVNMKMVVFSKKAKENGECRVYVQLTHKRKVTWIKTSIFFRDISINLLEKFIFYYQKREHKKNSIANIEKYKGIHFMMWFADNCFLYRKTAYKPHTRQSELQWVDSKAMSWTYRNRPILTNKGGIRVCSIGTYCIFVCVLHPDKTTTS